MSNFSRKVTSAVSVLAFVTTTLSASVTAYAGSEFLQYAEVLASNGIVSAQDTEAGYRLADNVTRAEMAKVAVNLAGLTPTDCAGDVFSDVSSNLGDLCGYVEAAAEAGIVSTANANFRPTALVTRAEMVKMLLSAVGEEQSSTDAGFMDVAGLGDLAGFVNRANELGIAKSSDYFRPNANASRGEAFKIAAGAAGLVIDTTDPETETPVTNTGVTLAGDLTVKLASTTAASANLPKGAAGVKVVTFDVTAGSADVTLSSLVLKQVGLGGGTLVSALSIFNSLGRVSKVKASPFNNSDKTATIVLTNGLVVKAGTTETLSVVVTIDAAAATSEEFSIQVDSAASVSSTAATIVGSFPVVGNTHKIAAVTAGEVTFNNDGTPANPTLGDKNVEVAKFKLNETGSNKETITVSQITLRETGDIDEGTDLGSFKLYADGVEVASAAKTYDKYVTFMLATPITIKDAGNVKFSVRADVNGGPAKVIAFDLDNVLDVTAVGSQYNVGVKVVDAFTASSITVKAGTVGVSYADATATQFLKNKKDIVLGTVTLTNSQGKALEIAAANITLESTGTGVNGMLENVELYDVAAGTVYDLTPASTNLALTSVVFSDTNTSIALGATKTFQIRADSKDVTFGAADKVSVKVTGLGGSTTAAGFLIQETADDNAVTDVTPSAVSMKSLQAIAASATLTLLPLSAAKSAVVGSQNVEALTFEVKANDATSIKIRELKVTKSAGTALFNNTTVSAVKLYKDSVSDANLVKSIGGGSIATSIATFDNINVEIAKNATQKFVVTVSLVDDQALATQTLALATSAFDLVDSDGDTVASPSNVTSARTITYLGVGTLAVAVDNTNSKINDKEVSVLAGTTSKEIAAVKLTATNEAVTAKDILVTLSGSATPQNTVSTVQLVKADGTVIVSKSVTSASVLFEDVNYAVAEGSESIYVKVVTQPIGKDRVGAAATLQALVTVTDAEGVSSKKVVTASNGSTYSKLFAVSSVRVSSVAFVSSYNGVTRTSKLGAGSNNLAIVQVTADSTSNTKQLDAEMLKTVLKALNLKVAVSSGTALANVTVERVGGSSGAVALTLAGGYAANASLVAGLGTDAEVNGGSSAYFVVKGDVTTQVDVGNDSIQVSFDAFNASQLLYGDNDGGTNVDSLRLDITKLDGDKITD